MISQQQRTNHLWAIFLSLALLVVAVGYFVVAKQTLYKAGDNIGYNMGLVGGIMLLFPLCYTTFKHLSIRKKFAFLSHFGKLTSWFKMHMIFGVLGPVLVIFHSTFHMRSDNAEVAMICMLLAAGSGTFGRFFYTKVHHGLYGRETTMNELKDELEQLKIVNSEFSFAPHVEKALGQFRANAEKHANTSSMGLVNFIKTGLQASTLQKSLSKELHQSMLERAQEGIFTEAQNKSMEELYREYHEKLIAYLKAVRDASQYHTYERIFPGGIYFMYPWSI
ncbi:MAG: hypothetical protein WDM70_01490 [Nitrosomonadales bacterium]